MYFCFPPVNFNNVNLSLQLQLELQLLFLSGSLAVSRFYWKLANMLPKCGSDSLFKVDLLKMTGRYEDKIHGSLNTRTVLAPCLVKLG